MSYENLGVILVNVLVLDSKLNRWLLFRPGQKPQKRGCARPRLRFISDPNLDLLRRIVRKWPQATQFFIIFVQCESLICRSSVIEMYEVILGKRS